MVGFRGFNGYGLILMGDQSNKMHYHDKMQSNPRYLKIEILQFFWKSFTHAVF